MPTRMLLTAGMVLAACGLFGYVLIKRIVQDEHHEVMHETVQVSLSSDEQGARENGPVESDPVENGLLERARSALPGTGDLAFAQAPARSAAPKKTSAPKSTGTGAKPKTGAAPAKPLLEGWQAPAAAFVISGELHGYIEPCGCSLHQLGGLSRRADLFRQISERGWPVTGLDVGGLVNYPTRRQGKFKFGMILKCLAHMRYSAVAMGVEELQIGADFLSYNNPAELPFSFLSANVVLFGTPDLEQGPARKKIVKIGDKKVGITAVFGLDYKKEVLRPGEDEENGDMTISDPVAALAKVVPELQAERPDLLVLLSHARTAETAKFLQKFPQFDLVVTAGGSEDPDPKPNFIGKTLVVAPGQKGKHVAVVGFYPGAKERLKFESVGLDEDRFRDTPKIHEEMQSYQDLLKEANLVATEPAIESPRNAVVKEDNPFVGVKVCGECHKSALEVWQNSKHAHATVSLKTGRPEQAAKWINRIFDPECIACHVTGWDPQRIIRFNTGYTGEETTPQLVGQQCENCHGPGGRHTAVERQFAKDKKRSEEIDRWRKFQRLSVKKAFDLCANCHDGDNDPHFSSDSFKKYWEEIAHPGKD